MPLQSDNPFNISEEDRERFLATIPREHHAKIEKLAGELAKDKDFRQAAEILKLSEALEDTKFAEELGWLAAVSVAIAFLAI
jgi:hypothetical protein